LKTARRPFSGRVGLTLHFDKTNDFEEALMAFRRKPPQGNVRRVRTNGKNIRGIITNKTGRTVQYESFNEFRLILLLERDASVADYISQPLTIEYFDRTGQRHTYTPDFKVLRTNDEIEIHEVTLSKRSARDDLQNRHRAGREYCRKKGWKYVLLTEKELPSGVAYANLSALYGFRARAYYIEIIANTAKNLLLCRSISLVTLINQIAHMTEAPAWLVSGCLLHLLWLDCLKIASGGLLFLDGYLNPEIAIALSLDTERKT
jgi:hypothetical protein